MREKNKFLYTYRYSEFLKKLKTQSLSSVSRKKPIHELHFKKIAILFDATNVEEKTEILEFEKIK